MRHAEIAIYLVLGVTPLLVTQYHHGLAAEPRQTTDNGRIIGIHPVAVHFLEIGKQAVDVIQRIRALRMARHLRDLPRAELGVNVFRQRLALFLQAADFFRNIQRRIVLHIPQFFDLGFQIGNRLFKIEECRFHRLK